MIVFLVTEEHRYTLAELLAEGGETKIRVVGVAPADGAFDRVEAVHSKPSPAQRWGVLTSLPEPLPFFFVITGLVPVIHVGKLA